MAHRLNMRSLTSSSLSALRRSALLGVLSSSAVAWGSDAVPPPITPAVSTGESSSRDGALVIGNEAYHALPQAQWATNDARAFVDWLAQSRGVSAYRTMLVENADEKTISKAARRLRWRVRRNGTAWIYYAGHGIVLPDGRRALVPIDANGVAIDTAAIPFDDLADSVLRNRSAGRLVVIVDSGFGGVGRDGFEVVPGRDSPEPRAVREDNDRLVMWVADVGLEPSQVYPAAKQGLFTWTVLGGLRGWADGSVMGETDGRVTLQEAQVFAKDAGVMLGRDVHPSIDRRPEQQTVSIVQGPALEARPTAETFEALADADVALRLAAAEDRVRSDASLFWQDTLQQAQAGGPGGRQALEAYIAEFEGATVSVERRVYLEQVVSARRMLETYDESAPPSAPAGEAAAAPATCDNLVDLEPDAMMGTLSPAVATCLERRVRTDRMQTDRNKVSRLLIVNAEAARAVEEWERLMHRHLEDIDRSDPDLCLRYAAYLHKTRDVELAEDAIRWAGVALENKHIWDGDAYVKKVSGLHRLRAEAAHRLWVSAEKARAADPNPDSDRMAREFRGDAKSYSREWLDYVRAAGLGTDRAYQMCLSAAGAEMFCAAE